MSTQETATASSIEPADQRRRASRLSIAFSIAGLAMGLACWAVLAAIAWYVTNKAAALAWAYLMVFGGPFVLLLGLIFTVVAYVPRGRVWPLATLSLLVNLTFPCFYHTGAAGFGLKQSLLAVGAVCFIVGAAVGTILFLNRLARRRGWSGRARATALILGLSVVGLLAFVMFVVFVG